MRDIVQGRVSLRANEGRKRLSMHRRQYQHGSIRKKNGNWTLRYRDYFYDGTGKLRTASRTRILMPSSKTKSEARRAADRFTAKLGLGMEGPRQVISFRDFWEKHFMPNVISYLKPSTQALYGSLAKAHLLPALGDDGLDEITRLDIQRFINSKHAAGYSSKTLSHFRNLLSKAFGSAVRWNLSQANPATEIELPPAVRVREARVLNPEEIEKLGRNLAEPARTIFLVGILLGLRIGELLALKVGDVDLLKLQLCIRQDVYRGKVGTPKTAASERMLPLPRAAVAVLASHCKGKKQDDWLFPSSAGVPLDDRNLVRHQVKPVCDRLGIPRFGWHAMRHTLSTYGGNDGIAMPVLQSLLGHTSTEMTMRYTHPLEAAQRQAVERLASQLWPTVAQQAVN